MKQVILSNWNFMRVLRLLLGIAIAVQALVAKDAMFGIAGILLTSMAIFNVGCCGTSGCNTQSKSTTEKNKEISYEEVV